MNRVNAQATSIPSGYRSNHFFLAVLAESLKSLAEGAFAVPGLFIFSPEPAAIRFCLALMLAYRPFGFFEAGIFDSLP